MARPACEQAEALSSEFREHRMNQQGGDREAGRGRRKERMSLSRPSPSRQVMMGKGAWTADDRYLLESVPSDLTTRPESVSLGSEGDVGLRAMRLGS